VHAEALAILGTMAADPFINRWDLEVLPDVSFGRYKAASVIILSLTESVREFLLR
jgi:hypothetical protein